MGSQNVKHTDSPTFVAGHLPKCSVEFTDEKVKRSGRK